MNKVVLAKLDEIHSTLVALKDATTKPLDLTEAAAYLHISKSHLYQLTSCDIGQTFEVKRPVQEYWLGILTPARMRRIQHGNQSLTFANGKKAILLYDKQAESHKVGAIGAKDQRLSHALSF